MINDAKNACTTVWLYDIILYTVHYKTMVIGDVDINPRLRAYCTICDVTRMSLGLYSNLWLRLIIIHTLVLEGLT